MNKVCLALIHNHNAKRNATIQPRLVELNTFLSGRFEVQILEVAYQSQIKPHGWLIAFLRDVIYQALDRDWLRYRHLVPQLLPRHIASFMLSSLKSGRYSKKAGGGGWRRSSAIEMAVTDKHIRAWLEFLDTSADFLICFEDDSVFKEDSDQRLTDLLDRLSREYPSRSVYVDLAGGCSLDALHIDKLQTARDASFRYYSMPVTNTACAYLLSRPLAANFHEILLGKPWLRLIGVDWMMNALMMRMKMDGVNCDCMHADPTIFSHGSVTGEYVPWAR